MVVNIGLVMAYEGIQLRYCIIAPVGDIRVQQGVELGRVCWNGEIEEDFGELAVRGKVAV